MVASMSTMMTSLKKFTMDVAERDGITASGVYRRINRGTYPSLILLRKNSRVVFVVNPKDDLKRPRIKKSRWGFSDKLLGHAEYVRRWRWVTGRAKNPQLHYRAPAAD
jgi:hypothetical protein